MPDKRTTRQKMKRKVEQAEGSVQNALEYLAEVWQVYEAPHPEISEHISILMEGLDTALEALKSFNQTL